MIAELGLHRALDFVDVGAEDDLVEFGDHLAWTERAEITTAFTGRTGRMFAGQIGKIGTADNLAFQFFTEGFVINQNMSCSGLSP